MKMSCCGWANDSYDLLFVMNQMIAEQIQIISVVVGNSTALVNRWHVFGIAEEESQLNRVSERVEKKYLHGNAGFLWDVTL